MWAWMLGCKATLLSHPPEMQPSFCRQKLCRTPKWANRVEHKDMQMPIHSILQINGLSNLEAISTDCWATSWAAANSNSTPWANFARHWGKYQQQCFSWSISIAKCFCHPQLRRREFRALSSTTASKWKSRIPTESSWRWSAAACQSCSAKACECSLQPEADTARNW